jgi:hypothetical protein
VAISSPSRDCPQKKPPEEPEKTVEEEGQRNPQRPFFFYLAIFTIASIRKLDSMFTSEKRI